MTERIKEYIISDTHFLHDNIVSYCERPKDHNERMMLNMALISSKDILYHLGDICMGKDEEVHERFIEPLSCRKVLIRGNHDGKSNTWYLDHGWDFVCDGLELKKFGQVIRLSHEPLPWDGRFTLNIHGHLHNLARIDEYTYLRQWHYLVAVEKTGYAPVLLKTICSLKE